MKTVFAVFSVTAALLAVLGCGSVNESTEGQTTTTPTPQGPDFASGGDQNLAGAVALYQGTTTDTVNAAAGDNTDYRLLDVSADGELTVRIHLIDPVVIGEFSMRDAYGDEIVTRRITQGLDAYAVESVDVQPGRYYISVHAEEGASEYLLTWEFDERQVFTETRYEEPEEEEQPRRRRSHRSRRDDDGGSRRNDEPEEEQEEEQAASEEEEFSVTASVLTVRDGGSAGGSLLVLTNCGSDSGLHEGDVGRIRGTDFRATIRRITGGSSCEAHSEGTPSQLSSASRVQFE